MPTHLTFESGATYLRVTVEGRYPGTESRRLFESIKSRADEASLKSVLIDAATIQPPRTNMDRYVVGSVIAELFGSEYRLAIVCDRNLFNSLMEDVAFNRGAQVLVTGSEMEAVEWIQRHPRR